MEYRQIVDWIKSYALERGFSLVVGVSGGVDSALVSTLCAETGIATYVVSMPIRQKADQLERARAHIDWLVGKYRNVHSLEYDLTVAFESFASVFGTDMRSDLSLANSRSRIRMAALYQVSGNVNGIVVGTGNKIEDFGVGFFTKYGDGGVDISPIADLTKTEVRQMASSLGVSDYIVTARPTDGLWEDDRSDEDQLGASYEELEWAMSFEGDEVGLDERQVEVLEIYRRFHSANLHKMVPVPVFKK